MLDMKTIDYFTGREARQERFLKKMKEKIKNYEEDTYRDTRKKEMLCKYCYYIMSDRISGQSFCTTECLNCKKEMSFGNTDTDELCMECAEELNRCKHCGVKMD